MCARRAGCVQGECVVARECAGSVHGRAGAKPTRTKDCAWHVRGWSQQRCHSVINSFSILYISFNM
jgi:hypothetical protein